MKQAENQRFLTKSKDKNKIGAKITKIGKTSASLNQPVFIRTNEMMENMHKKITYEFRFFNQKYNNTINIEPLPKISLWSSGIAAKAHDLHY